MAMFRKFTPSRDRLVTEGAQGNAGPYPNPNNTNKQANFCMAGKRLLFGEEEVKSIMFQLLSIPRTSHPEGLRIWPLFDPFCPKPIGPSIEGSKADDRSRVRTSASNQVFAGEFAMTTSQDSNIVHKVRSKIAAHRS